MASWRLKQLKRNRCENARPQERKKKKTPSGAKKPEPVSTIPRAYLDSFAKERAEEAIRRGVAGKTDRIVKGVFAKLAVSKRGL